MLMIVPIRYDVPNFGFPAILAWFHEELAEAQQAVHVPRSLEYIRNLREGFVLRGDVAVIDLSRLLQTGLLVEEVADDEYRDGLKELRDLTHRSIRLLETVLDISLWCSKPTRVPAEFLTERDEVRAFIKPCHEIVASLWDIHRRLTGEIDSCESSSNRY